VSKFAEVEPGPDPLKQHHHFEPLRPSWRLVLFPAKDHREFTFLHTRPRYRTHAASLVSGHASKALGVSRMGAVSPAPTMEHEETVRVAGTLRDAVRIVGVYQALSGSLMRRTSAQVVARLMLGARQSLNSRSLSSLSFM